MENFLDQIVSSAVADSHITSDGNGNEIVKSLSVTTGSLTRISKFSGTASTSPTFFNHGLGVIPDIVLLQFNGLSSTAHSIWCDYASMTATQCKIQSDGSNAFVGLALKF